MIDSRGLIHVPRGVRIAALSLLLVTLLTAITVTVHFTLRDNAADPKDTDWILVSMSLLHLALSGLAVALVLFYSEREVNTLALMQKTEEFLLTSVPDALARVSASYVLRHQGSQVTRLGRNDLFGATYQMQSGPHQLKVWVGLNVSRLFTIFWLNVPADTLPQAYAKKLQQYFEFTFNGAAKIGYYTSYEAAELEDGTHIVSIWSSVDAKHNLLTEPSRRLFWLQDLAMMTESFWRTLLRHELISPPLEPSPL